MSRRLTDPPCYMCQRLLQTEAAEAVGTEGILTEPQARACCGTNDQGALMLRALLPGSFSEGFINCPFNLV